MRSSVARSSVIAPASSLASASPLRCGTAPSSRFNKLLALLREEHIKHLEECMVNSSRALDEHGRMHGTSSRVLHRSSTGFSVGLISERTDRTDRSCKTWHSTPDSEDQDIPSERSPLPPPCPDDICNVESSIEKLGTTSQDVSKLATISMPTYKPFRHFETRIAWVDSTHYQQDVQMSRMPEDAKTFSDVFELPDDPGCFMMHPNSKKLLTWDILGLVLIAYELVVLPLQTFGIDDSMFMLSAEWVRRGFWSLDILVSPSRGYFSHGRLIMSFAKAVRRYWRTWFILDGFLVLIDWVLVVIDLQASGDQDQSIGLVRVLRIARLARMLRVLRILKVKRLFSSISDIIRTDILVIYFKFTMPLCGILFLIHWIACGWYGIGVLFEEKDLAQDWITASNSHQRDKFYAYFTCLHWSLGQFTLGSIDVYAQNTYERLYTVFVLLLGVVVFSILIGGFTSAAEEIREVKSEKTKKFSLLRRFLLDYRVSQRLTARIQKHCEYAYGCQKSRLQESDVKLLDLISEQLKQELAKEIFTPELKPHPLFRMMVHYPCSCLDKICRLALFPHSYAQDDMIFANDVAAVGMIMFTDGTCNYVQRDVDGSRTSTKIRKDEWLCEPVLWTSHWLTYGKAKATTHSRAVFVDAFWFEKVFSEVEARDWQLVHLYATEFVSMLNNLPSHEINDLLPGGHESSSPFNAGDSTKDASFSQLVMENINWPNGARKSSGSGDKRMTTIINRVSHRVSKRASRFSVRFSQFSNLVLATSCNKV